MKTRRKILEKSQELFHSLGFDQTSISQIAQACGISKGALYHHFKSKEEVLEEICRGEYLAMKQLFTPLAEQRDKNPLERIKDIMTLVRSSAMNQAAVSFQGKEGPSNALLDLTLDRYSERLYREIFGPLLEEAREDGLCRFSGSPQNMALYLHHLDSSFSRIVQSAIKRRSMADLQQAMEEFPELLSRVLQIPRETLYEILLIDEMEKNYTGLLEKMGENKDVD